MVYPATALTTASTISGASFSTFTSSLFPLHIFPAGGLASSVITTVWVGIFVVALFNLRFGWVMSGLIVPGYLVPLLLIKPSAAWVVLLEGVLTYWLVWFYSEFLAMRMGWSRFFGRDRFFVMVLTSVAVRIVSDGYLLPLLGQYLNDHWQWQFDYQNNLHSFGLIITALVANNFWKTGLRRGSFAMFVTIGITYCIVRFVLMEYTNFSMSNIGFLYEDIATSFLASPKSYIILIVTAFVASRMNLYYGWDFSGILIPSLLALQWFAPQKIVMSMIEAIVILLLAMLTLQAPLFKRITVEGARKVLLFFNLGFAYKIVLSYLLLWYWPGIKVSDFYGFGYLLPTLIALKMHDKKIFARMSTALLQTSLAATLIATLLGFGLSLLPDPLQWLPGERLAQQKVQPQAVHTSLPEWLLAEKQHNYQSLGSSHLRKPDAMQTRAFEAALRLLQDGQATPAQLAQAAQLLHDAHYDLQQQGSLLLLTERAPRNYWGSFAINLAAPNSLLLEVPRPFDEALSLEAAGRLFQQLDARFLAIAGSSRHAMEDGGADVLIYPNTLFQSFHRSFARRNTLQIRASGASISTLYLKGEIAPQLSLPRLQAAFGQAQTNPAEGTQATGQTNPANLQLHWQKHEESNLQRETMANGFAELSLARSDIARLLLAQTPSQGGAPELRKLTGNLGDWLAFDKTGMAASGSNLYRTPSAGELIYLDKDVLTPLVQSLQSGASAHNMQLWQMINLSAQALGYELQHFSAPPKDTAAQAGAAEQFLLLSEKADAAPRRYWGSLVFRLGQRQPYTIQVPRPYFEPNSLEMGIALFSGLQANAIFIANASPLANLDHGADLLALQNKGNLLNLASQIMLRESPAQPNLTVQARALSQRPERNLPEAPLLLSFGSSVGSLEQATPLGRGLLQQLQKTGYRYQFADGSPDSSEYGAAAALQSAYQNTGQNKELALLWISPLASINLRQQTLPNGQNMQFKALGIAREESLDLAQLLARAQPARAALPEGLQAQLNRYLQKQDVVLLHEIVRQHPALRFDYLVDQGTHRAYLLLWQGQSQSQQPAWLAALNLSARDASRVQYLAPDKDQATQAERFVAGNQTWWLADASMTGHANANHNNNHNPNHNPATNANPARRAASAGKTP